MISHYVLLAAALFAVGAYGVLARRNLLLVLMSLELMLNGANISLVAFSLTQPAPLGHGVAAVGGPHGHVFVLLVMAVAAAEVAVGLAIVISVFRTRQTVDTCDLQELHG